MATEPVISEERLALIAIAATSAQPWESRHMAAECLAHRVANRPMLAKPFAPLEPARAKEPPA